MYIVQCCLQDKDDFMVCWKNELYQAIEAARQHFENTEEYAPIGYTIYELCQGGPIKIERVFIRDLATDTIDFED